MYVLPHCSPQLTAAVSTPVDIKHSGFKSLIAFIKASAQEGLIELKEVKGGVAVTGTNPLRVVQGRFNRVFNIGVNGSHPSVRAHAGYVTVKDVKLRRGKQKEVQTQETEKTEKQHHTRPVTHLREPGPVNITSSQRVGNE
jgi:hypothetical protein